MRALRKIVALVLAALTVWACSVETQGEDGNLVFKYRSPDQFFSDALDTGIAQGTRATMEVRVAGAQDLPLTIETAKTGDEGVARVVATDGDVLTLEGVAPGVTEIVVATSKGEDRTQITVSEVGSIELRPLPETDRVLVGGTEPFMVVRKSTAGEALVGEAALTASELSVGPAGVAEVAALLEHRVMVRYLTEGTATVGVGDDPLSRDVVALDEVASFELLAANQEQGLPIGGSAYAAYDIKDAGGEELGARLGLVELTITDPEVCSVEEGDYLGLVGFRLDGLKPGECALTARLGEEERTYSVMFVEP